MENRNINPKHIHNKDLAITAAVPCFSKCAANLATWFIIEVGWPVESDLLQNLVVGIRYSLDPYNTGKESCHKSPQFLQSLFDKHYSTA